jgi:peptidoglycan/LPS O-acetylase OafA/YrhL
MFGFFRYFLANLVVLNHLGGDIFINTGPTAVVGFLLLSGYFAAYSFNKKTKQKNIWRYYLKRIVRIYPTYIIILGFTIILFLLFPKNLTLFGPIMSLPNDLLDWLKNISIIGLGPVFGSELNSTRIIPSAWYLHTILIFYILAPLIYKKRIFVYLWFFASLSIAIYYYFTNASFELMHYSFQSASLSLSLGSLIYYFTQSLDGKNKVLKLINNYYDLILSTLIFIFIINFLLSFFVNRIINSQYIYILIFSILIILLKYKSFPKWSKVDYWLGKISYPMFLLHLPIGALMCFLLFNNNISYFTSPERVWLFFVSLPLINILSFAVVGVTNLLQFVISSAHRATWEEVNCEAREAALRHPGGSRKDMNAIK